MTVAIPREQSNLPGQITEHGWLLPDDLSWDEYHALAPSVGHLYTFSQWMLGDYLVYGEYRFGERYVQAADDTGLDPETLKAARWVAKSVTGVRRRTPRLSYSHHREVAPQEPDDQDRWLDLAEEKGWSVHELRNQIRNVGDKMAVHYSSDSPEWYTPPHIIDRVAKVLERIDLDPCSNSHDDPAVPATEVYTTDDDGLSQPWHGRVYMNPPYGSEISKWVEKLAAEFEAGNVREAIALVPARVDTSWFRRLPATYVCFINGRLTFSGCDNAAPFPSALLYLGPRADRFLYTFEDIGTCFKRLERT